MWTTHYRAVPLIGAVSALLPSKQVSNDQFRSLPLATERYQPGCSEREGKRKRKRENLASLFAAALP
ncbi:hypothetical protein BHE74_00047172 [Ensete ventricosum]|nr:hypothetical protein BHE74_00047172 [Ensete ventricosum]